MTWTITKEELIELLIKDYRLLAEEMDSSSVSDIMEKEGVLSAIIREANAVASHATALFNGHYKYGDDEYIRGKPVWVIPPAPNARVTRVTTSVDLAGSTPHDVIDPKGMDTKTLEKPPDGPGPKSIDEISVLGQTLVTKGVKP